MSRVRRLMRKVPVTKTRKVAKAVTKKAKKKKEKEKEKVVEVTAKVRMLPDGDHLASVVTAFDRKPEKVRIGGKWIHVSYLVGGECLRALQIGSHLNVSALKKPTGADRLVWAIGKAVEKHIRDTVIAAVGKDKVFGRWSCACNGLQFDGLGTDDKCSRCKGEANDYSEFNVKDESMLLSGSPDLLLMVGGTPDDPVLMVVEIKSIKVVPKGGVRTNAPDFHNLESPSRTHALQGLLYKGMMERAGFRMVDNVVVYYAAKDYVTCNPYKPFNVDANEQHNAFSIDALCGMATDYAEMEGTGKLLPRISQCTSASCTRAKACPVGAHCFSIKDDRIGKPRS